MDKSRGRHVTIQEALRFGYYWRIAETTFLNPGRRVEMRASDAHESRANCKRHNKLRLTQNKSELARVFVRGHYLK